jgi:hypothetical protein
MDLDAARLHYLALTARELAAAFDEAERLEARVRAGHWTQRDAVRLAELTRFALGKQLNVVMFELAALEARLTERSGPSP